MEKRYTAWPGELLIARHHILVPMSGAFREAMEIVDLSAIADVRICDTVFAQGRRYIECLCGQVVYVCGDPIDYRAEHAARLRAHSRVLTDRLDALTFAALCEPIKKEVPTTACFDCETIIPVADTYVSTRDERALCEACFKKAKKAGRAKCHVVR